MPAPADTLSTTPAPASAVFEFADFGCGAGASFAFAQSLGGGPGFGVDVSQEAVSLCNAAGLKAELGDLLEYTGRNIASVAVAVDLLPELGDRQAFELGVSKLVLAARNYAVIQHSFFDADAVLAQQGLHIPGNFGKRVRFRPGIADYIQLVARLAPSLNITGLAIFGIGEARATPIGLAGDVQSFQPMMPAFRSLRVVIGRKETARFSAGLRRARAGEQLFLWQEGA